MPRTGGGEIVMMKASCISAVTHIGQITSALSPWRRAPGTAGAERKYTGVGCVREGRAIEPGNWTACDPGVAQILAVRRTTASVRASEAPGGAQNSDQISLVLVGDEAGGSAANRQPVSPMSPA
jgi:hypothetical protein